MAFQTSAFSVHEFPEDPSKALITDGERFERLIRFLENRPLIVDWETSGLAWYQGAHAVGVGLGSWDDQGRLWTTYTPFRHRTGQIQLDPEVVLRGLRVLFENPATLKISHNIKFEDHFARREGLRLLGPRYCTMVASRLYDENRFSDLEYRASTDGGHGERAWKASKMLTRVVAKLAKANKMKITEYKNRFGYSEVPIELCGYYGCHDIQFAGELCQVYEAWGVSRNYPRIWPTEMALTRILCDVEQNGMLVNVEYLEGVREEMRRKKEELSNRIYDTLGGYTPNWSSDDELRAFMLDRLGCRWDTLTKAGRKAIMDGKKSDFNLYKHLSVDVDVLTAFAQKFDVLQHVLDWRKADKIDSTYTTSILEKLDVNSYVHGNLKQVGTNTGRLSCEDPNYQNMPKGELIRSAFQVIGEEWFRIFMDYSQIELRTLAWYSRDPLMVQTYLEGGDIHETTRREVSAMAGREVDRRLAKVINFGLSYCLTEQGMANQAHLSIEDATYFLNSFFQRFSGIVSFRQELWAHARRQNCQWSNIFGRTRRVPGLVGGQRWERRRAERVLVASAIQGTAAELTKESLVRLDRMIDLMGLRDRVRLCNTVHDEIQTDVHRSCLGDVVRESTRLMEDYPEFSPIPILVDTEITETNWGEKVPFEEWQKWSQAGGQRQNFSAYSAELRAA